MRTEVPVLSVVFMSFTLLFSLAFPVLLFFWYRKKRAADILPFFIGCAVFLVFAMLLEGLVNNLIFVRLPIGKRIRENLWLYAILGGFMAGLFEESGRFIAMKTVLRRFHKKDQNALMYGAGHGGFEVIMVAGMGSVNNLIYSFLLNIGREDMLTLSIPEAMRGEYLPQLEQVFDQLRNLPSWMFLVSPVERIPAVIFHIALSVLVWQAARKREKWYLFPLAMLLHLLFDSSMVLIAGAGVHTLLVEGFILAFSLLAALFSFAVYRRNRTPEAVSQN